MYVMLIHNIVLLFIFDVHNVIIILNIFILLNNDLFIHLQVILKISLFIHKIHYHDIKYNLEVILVYVVIIDCFSVMIHSLN